MAKIFKSYILTLSHPKGHVMSAKCDEPIDELAVQVWLLYHPNFKYCTLFVCGTELWTDRRTDGQTIRLLDAPADLSGRWQKKKRNSKMVSEYNICILFSKFLGVSLGPLLSKEIFNHATLLQYRRLYSTEIGLRTRPIQQ